MRTVIEMYNDIRNWEMDAGEDFMDYFGSNLNEANLLFWALGKGYINELQFQIWEDNQSYASNTEILLGEEEFSIVNENDYEDYDDALKKAYTILAEFLASSKTYQRRVEEFLSDVRQVSFDDAWKEFRRPFSKVFFVIDDVRTDLKKDTPLTADIIRQAKWYIDERIDA